MKNIGLIGFGCVGTGFYQLFKQEKQEYIIRGIAVKDAKKKRIVTEEPIIYDYRKFLDDPQIDIIIEVIDDPDVALNIARDTLSAGKNLISANKRMIAGSLHELLLLAKANNVTFRFEAAVCGAIPILRTLDSYWRLGDIERIQGIVNGSSNYILSQMRTKGQDYSTALREAQDLGYAESNPSLDVEGYDASFKLSILQAFAFGRFNDPSQILRVGIAGIEFCDIHFARIRNWRIKLVASADEQGISYVLPQFVESNDSLFEIEDAFNAVKIESAEIGAQVYSGKGAGSIPTGKAVLEDLVAIDKGYDVIESSAKPIRTEGHLEVYLRYPAGQEIGLFPFQKVHENFKSSLLNYVIGQISLSELRELSPLFASKGYFLSLLPPNYLGEKAKLLQKEAVAV